MNVEIQITGQISGNFALLNKLNNNAYKKGMFNSFIIYCQTIGEAKKLMRLAYKQLKRECIDSDCKLPSISKCNEYLSYDASRAEIIR
jgi:putative hemolysin